MKGKLSDEILKNMFSLREMECEGSSGLYIVLDHHYQKEIMEVLFDKIKSSFLKLIKKTPNIIGSKEKEIIENLDLQEIITKEDLRRIDNSKLNQVNCLMKLILQLDNIYIKFFSTPDSLFTNILSLHTYFVYIKNLIEEQKLFLKGDKSNTLFKTKSFTDQLIDIILNLIKINNLFCKYLLNNGVAEFNTDGGIMQQNNEEISGKIFDYINNY